MYSLSCNLTGKENAPLYIKEETKTMASCQRKHSKISLSDSVYVSAVWSRGEERRWVELLLCMYDCGASILFVHDSLY
jgi:hypothetical protein